jgi:hypothetical protein
VHEIGIGFPKNMQKHPKACDASCLGILSQKMLRSSTVFHAQDAFPHGCFLTQGYPQITERLLIKDGNYIAGIGLTNMKKRAEMIGASITIQSHPGEGTK